MTFRSAFQMPQKKHDMPITRMGLGCGWLRLLLAIVILGCATQPTAAQEPPAKMHTHDDGALMRYLRDMERRLRAVEDGSPNTAQSTTNEVNQGEVDLSDIQVPFSDETGSDHILGKPWYEIFEFWGFVALDLLATGNEGREPAGGFSVKEATLFAEAEVWEDISGYVELQVVRLGNDHYKWGQTGEVHVHFRNVLKQWGDGLLGIKVGRVDIPFGEEYLWQDSIDNPLITQSAGYPYGFDEGIVFYGTLSDVGWIVAVTDGTDGRSFEDDSDKAVNVKVYGSPTDWLYLSGSFMRNGQASESAFEFGGSHFQPVGAGHMSSLGSSPSEKLDAILYELDAKITISERAYIALSFGQAYLNDDFDAFDRDLMWFSVEGLCNITEKVYAVIRYSEIGTYDSDEGYHFDGKITAGGNRAFGYDASRLQRLSAGIGWRINPKTVLKAEVGADWFDVIDASSLRPSEDDRWLAGIELVVGF